jgi:hypothetical protein
LSSMKIRQKYFQASRAAVCVGSLVFKVSQR